MTLVRLVTDPALAPTARSLLAAAGRHVGPPSGRREAGDVAEVDATTPSGVRVAILAAMAGASVLAVASDDTRPTLVSDLGDLGPVEVWQDNSTDLPAVAGLAAEQVAVLAALARGASTAEAAAEVHLSVRSAERRLKQARDALRVGSVAEAVVLLGRELGARR